MITKNGIAYDLSESPYDYEMPNLMYVFSSKLHRKKFIQRYPKNRTSFHIKFIDKYGIDLDTDLLADILLYESIETRGFMIWLKNRGVIVRCKNDLILNGVNAMKRNLNE